MVVPAIGRINTAVIEGIGTSSRIKKKQHKKQNVCWQEGIFLFPSQKERIKAIKAEGWRKKGMKRVARKE